MTKQSMKRNKPALGKMSLPDAIKSVAQKHRTNGRGRINTIRQKIEQTVGEANMPLFIEMVTDPSLSHAYIWRVIAAMGVEVSYEYWCVLRNDYISEYRWYTEMVADTDSMSMVESH